MEIYTRAPKQVEKTVRIAGVDTHKNYTDEKVLLLGYVKDVKKNPKAPGQAIVLMGYEDPELPGCDIYLDEATVYTRNSSSYQGQPGKPYADIILKRADHIKGRPVIVTGMKRTDNETGEVSYYGNRYVGTKDMAQYKDSAAGEGVWAILSSWFPSRQEGKENTTLCAFVQGRDANTIDPKTGYATYYDYVVEVEFPNGIPAEYLPNDGERSVLGAIVVPHSKFKQNYEGTRITNAVATDVIGFYPLPRIAKPEETAANEPASTPASTPAAN